MEKIQWHIITSENAEEVFKKLEGRWYRPGIMGIN